MNEKRNKLPTLLYVYVGLVLVACLYFFAVAAENPMGGIYAMLLTIPWSIALMQLLTPLFPELFETLWIGPLIILLSAAINVVIVVVITKRRKSDATRK